MPENRKGLFATHSATVAQYLKAYHVSIQARSEADVEPSTIMKRVTDSSGSKYGAAGDAANTQKGGPITPVGSSYKPVGTPDIKGMQAGAKRDVIEPVGTAYNPARNELANIRTPQASAAAPPPAPRQSFGSAPTVSGPKPVPTPATAPAAPPAPAPAPTPAAAPPAPAAPSVPPAPRPEPTAAPVAKVDDDDKIKPVGTAYEPVKLGKPGKLGDRAAMFSQAPAQSSAPPPVSRNVSGGGPGKLTWSQRQEQAKQQREEEDRKAREAINAGPGAPRVGGIASTPAAPAAPPAPTHTADIAEDLAATKLDEGTAEALAVPSSAPGGEKAVVVYDYQSAEDNEISLVEGQTITGIQQLDEGWWSGITPDGQEGLFPATYVELLPADSTAGGDAAEVPDAPPPPPAPPAPPAAPEPEVEPEAPPAPRE